jgi:hypothetical protein
MKTIFSSLALVGLLSLSSNASASDIVFTDNIDAGYAKVSVFTLPAGHNYFEVISRGTLTCMMLAPKMGDLISNDPSGRVRAIGGEIAVHNRCIINVSLKEPTLVLLLVQNDDETEQHSYWIHGMH